VAQIVEIERILMTPLGEAEADFMWVSDSADIASEYQCWIFETNEVWWFPQPLVRATKSMSAFRRGTSSPIELSAAQLRAYAPHILRHTLSPFHEQSRQICEKRSKGLS
jgi:hypothetical protein